MVAPATHEPLIRVESLHALLYCPRLFYFQEVEEIRVVNAAMYAGAELHASLAAAEEGEWTTLELESPRLGIKGKVDCLRRRNGQLIPYEHKRGRPRREDAPKAGTKRRSALANSASAESNSGPGGGDANNPPPGAPGRGQAHAWPSDRIQIAAYAMLLEDTLGQPISEGRIHYHAENVTVRVTIDDACRAEVLQAIAHARELRNSTNRPPVTDNERLCQRCSLAPVCLPEESRVISNSPGRAVRLYPPDDQRGTIHVLTQGAFVTRAGERLVVRDPDKKVSQAESACPIHEVAAVVLHGHAQISTQAVRLCADCDVPVHWLSYGGRYLAGLAIGAGGVHRRIRQYDALRDPAITLRLARALVHARIQGQHRYLLRATRGNAAARSAAQPALHSIGQSLTRVPTATEADVLRGLEGEAAAQYFSTLDHLLGPHVPPELRYGARSRRPPANRFNALLSFGYGLLHVAVSSAVLTVGLEPAFGFFHRPRSAAHPLVLDLMELFRVPLWDVMVIGSLNRGQWDPEADFRAVLRGRGARHGRGGGEQSRNETPEAVASSDSGVGNGDLQQPAGVWLSESGRRKAIQLFESRLEESWKHPALGYSLSYRRTLELEVRLLEKEWSGEPGLFARSRLR